MTGEPASPPRPAEADGRQGGEADGVRDAPSFAQASGATETEVAALQRFLEMLTAGNAVMNLVGPATLPDFWNRHAWDSAQLLQIAPDARTWADLGAGAGFPGLVLAILGKGRAGFHVHLVESMAKRCRFLSEVVRELDLPATVHNTRAENLSLPVDIVTARACAPLHRLLGYARPYLQAGAQGLFLKGQDVAADLKEATRYWDFDADTLPSRSDPRGRIVRVRRLGRARKV
ncbi:MAG: 16S rRNA (guanine(527)-N(7))-methyltransferase RsmG [Phenylobacterium sp.]|uniref:16S rRNA (guanine(527)-N(7))-methyltransferase RsmG n=1 Tax=Phenylobacterium sp. TaxID=1871053 RepID=UPI001A364B12|nr:16S rRNA (guanine(527)-N(7))-methyltransferase RsmG [Phenylobacterium sp.]MBL8774073.1 16S rRNA (guanine(527)-N(7))-methyltransferase RsmG [Phenylobacterium sp.]